MGILTILSSVVPYCSAQSDWPQYQYNAQHIGFNSQEQQLSPPLQLKWTRAFITSTPATIVEDWIFVAQNTFTWPELDRTTLFCLDLHGGDTIWSREFPGESMQPSYANGVLYLQIDFRFSSTVEALNPATGWGIWSSGYRAQIVYGLAPTVYDGKVLICGNVYGGMHCFDADSGDILWKTAWDPDDGWTPAAYQDEVYVFMNGRFIICDIDSGNVLWHTIPAYDTITTTKSVLIGSERAAPVLDTTTGLIYLTSRESLYAYDIYTRQKVWEVRRDSLFHISPALYQGKVYIVQEGVLKVYDGLTGDSLDTFVGTEEFLWWTAFEPVIANGYLYVSSDNWVHAVDLVTLEEVWSYNIGGKLSVGNGHLIVVTREAEVYAFSNLPTAVNDENDQTLPAILSLHQNYPNPFNSSTVIHYDLPTRSHIEISVFNILGRKVATLVSGSKSAGTHSVEWDGTNDQGLPVSSGTYFYRLKADDLIQTRKMVLLK